MLRLPLRYEPGMLVDAEDNCIIDMLDSPLRLEKYEEQLREIAERVNAYDRLEKAINSDAFFRLAKTQENYREALRKKLCS